MAHKPGRTTLVVVPVAISVAVLTGAAVGLTDHPPAPERSTTDLPVPSTREPVVGTATTSSRDSSTGNTRTATGRTRTTVAASTTSTSPAEATAGRPPGNLILKLTNRARARTGCPDLRPDPALARAAVRHSRDMAGRNYVSHTGSQGLGPIERARTQGYPSHYVSENVAAGNAAATDTFVQWMTSHGHRGNMLNCRFTEIGIGYAYDPDSRWGYYWTQLLGNPDA